MCELLFIDRHNSQYPAGLRQNGERDNMYVTFDDRLTWVSENLTVNIILVLNMTNLFIAEREDYFITHIRQLIVTNWASNALCTRIRHLGT